MWQLKKNKTKKAGLEVDGKKVKINSRNIANYDKYSKEGKTRKLLKMKSNVRHKGRRN